MESDTDDKFSKGGDRIFGDSLLSVGELGLTFSDSYCDLGSTSAAEFVEIGSISSCEPKKDKGANLMLPVQGNTAKTMSLLVGAFDATESLYERLRQAVPGHDIQRSQVDEAFRMCNSHRFQLIWLVVSTPVSQDTLSFTTTLRYMCMCRLNQTTRIIAVAEKSCDVDLQPHGIDVILVEPVTCSTIREVYSKWSNLDIAAAMPDLPKVKDNQLFSCFGDGDASSSNNSETRMEEDTPSKLPLTPLLAAIQGVKNSYRPRPKAPNVSDHTTKEKMRRERIKDSCDQLRVILPYIRGRKTDMASVLEMCVDYLRIVNIALPAEFQSEVAEILGKDCQVVTGKTREPKSTPRKRKRDLSKPPQSPSPNFAPSSVENSPMYTPPATPGSETGSDSVASPMSFNMNVDQSVMSPQEPCYVKLVATSMESSVTAPKAMLASRGRAKAQQIVSRNFSSASQSELYKLYHGDDDKVTTSMESSVTAPKAMLASRGRAKAQQMVSRNFSSASQSELYKLYHGDDVKVHNPVAQRGIDYLSTPRSSLPGRYSISMFNRGSDISLPPPNTFFQPNIGSSLMMPDNDLYRGGIDLEDPMSRYSTHSGFPLASSNTLPMDPLISYVNPNSVLPVSYTTRYNEPSIGHQATGDKSLKSEL